MSVRDRAEAVAARVVEGDNYRDLVAEEFLTLTDEERHDLALNHFGEQVRKALRRHTNAAEEMIEASAARRESANPMARKAAERLRAKIRIAVDDYVHLLRMEWTEEILSAPFALPDGSVVTWGSATAAQHEQRYEMFKNNADMNARGAARHRAAIEALRVGGHQTLRELTGQTGRAA